LKRNFYNPLNTNGLQNFLFLLFCKIGNNTVAVSCLLQNPYKKSQKKPVNGYLFSNHFHHKEQNHAKTIESNPAF